MNGLGVCTLLYDAGSQELEYLFVSFGGRRASEGKLVLGFQADSLCLLLINAMH